MTHVAFSEEHRAFRLEGIDQLTKMNVEVPESLIREIENRRLTEQAWEEGKKARNLKNAFERRTNRQGSSNQLQRKRQGSQNASPPVPKRLPVQSTPPAPGLGATGSQPPFQGQHPVQTSGSLPPRRDVQPTVPAPTHPPPAVAAPAGATQGHPVPGYYHHEYYN